VFRGRSAIEILVIVFTLTIAIVIIGFGAAIAFIKVRDPKVDVTDAARALLGVVASILSALLGLLAGKSEMLNRPMPPEPEHHEHEHEPTHELHELRWEDDPTDSTK